MKAFARACVATALTACGGAHPQFGGGTVQRHYGPPVTTTQVFTPAHIKQASLSYAYAQQTASQTLALTAGPTTTVTQRQISRHLNRDQFTQGDPGTEANQQFEVVGAGKLDLLLVMSDSPDMELYDQRLAPRLSALLSSLGNVDWQIGMITTSPTVDGSYGCLHHNPQYLGDHHVLTRADYENDPAQANAWFSWVVGSPDTRNSRPRGVYAAVEGLIGDCGDRNQPWRRDGAHTAVIMVSNEENCGSASNDDCHGEPGEFPQYFIDKMPGVQFFGIFYDEAQAPCQFIGWRHPDQYWWLADKTGGAWGNMCDDDYTPTLDKISAKLGPSVSYKFPLAYDPVDGTLSLEVDGQKLTNGFKVVGRTIHFQKALPLASKTLKASYLHDPHPRKTRFGLSAKADPATLQVTVDGQPADPTQVSFDTGTGEIVFQAMPADRAHIEVSYRDGTPLPRHFQVQQAFDPDFVTATVDGQTVPVSADPQTGTLTLATPPTDGAVVEFHVEAPGSRTLRYPLAGVSSASVESLQAADGVTGTPIRASLEEGELVFDKHDVLDGRPVTVTYELRPTDAPLSLALAQAPLPGTLTLTGGQDDACAHAAKASGATVSFPCPAHELGQVTVAYRYVAQVQDHFVMPGTYSDKAEWQVSVKGREIKDYRREGSTVVIPAAELGDGTSPVRIDVTEMGWNVASAAN